MDWAIQFNFTWLVRWWNFQLCCFFSIVPVLIQEDSLADSSAFWLTRPISKLQLLGEKSIFLGIMVLMMTFARFLELISAGNSLEAIFEIGCLFGLKIAALTSYLALISAITPSFRKYVLYAILGPMLCGLLAAGAGLIAQFLFKLILMIWFFAFHKDQYALGAKPFETTDFSGGFHMFNGNEAQDLIAFPVFFLAASALVYHQYMTRRTRVTRSLALAVLPMLVVVLTAALFVLGLCD